MSRNPPASNLRSSGLASLGASRPMFAGTLRTCLGSPSTSPYPRNLGYRPQQASVDIPVQGRLTSIPRSRRVSCIPLPLAKLLHFRRRKVQSLVWSKMRATVLTSISKILPLGMRVVLQSASQFPLNVDSRRVMVLEVRDADLLRPSGNLSWNLATLTCRVAKIRQKTTIELATLW